MVSRIELSENRVAFKKRALRPWKPVIELDHTNPNVPNVTAGHSEHAFSAEFPTELLHKPLETGLETQIKQRSDIQAKLSSLESPRMTLGGFFKLTNVLFLDEQESSAQTFYLLNALKDSTHEIAEIQHQLKLTELLEQNQKTALELQASQAGQRSAEQLYEAQLPELRQLKLERATLETKLKEKTSQYQELITLFEESQLQIQALRQEKSGFEHDLKRSTEKLDQTHQVLLFEKDHAAKLELQHQKLQAEREAALSQIHLLTQELTLERQASEEKAAPLLEHIKRMNIILEGERNLRQHLETQVGIQAEHMASLEARLKQEIQARRAAEENIKRTLTRASEAVLDVLHQTALPESSTRE